MLWGRTTYEMMESYWPAVARGDVEAPPAVREWAVKLETKPKYTSTCSWFTPGSPATARPFSKAGWPTRDGSISSPRSRWSTAPSPCTTGVLAPKQGLRDLASCPAADHVEQPPQDPLAIGPQAVVGVFVGDPGPQPTDAAGRLLGK